MSFKNLVDMHSHTDNSFDGHYPVDELCESSIKNGLKAVAFTDHVEIDCFTEAGFDISSSKSYKDISAAKERFKGLIDVCVGVELGEATYNIPVAEKLITQNKYDIVMGSIHNLRNEEDFWGLDYSEYDVNELLEQYYDELILLAQWAKFDSMSHLTYPLRYIVGEHNIPVDNSVYNKKIDEILFLLAQNDRALEINTSGLREPIGVTLPDESIIKRFKELGGKMVTVGSDSHYTKFMGYGIDEGMKIAKRCGFECVTIFKNRQPVEIAIE